VLPRVDLYQELLDLVRQIPPGMVSTPTAVAEALGDPIASRVVPRIVLELPREAPVHRVVHPDGTPITPGAEELLRSEGIRVEGGRVVDLEERTFRSFRSGRILQRLKEIQVEAASKVILEDLHPEPIELVAGVDVSYRDRKAYGACVVWSVREGRVVESSSSEVEVCFPYIPTYLSFREAPAMAEAVRPLLGSFDVLMVNGHGVAHPRMCGIASHLGVLLDVPSMGVARSLLQGFRLGGPTGGGWRPVLLEDVVVGAAVETGGSKPVYVSPGHMMSLERALETALRCLRGRRLPEPVRLAHALASKLRRAG